MSSVSRRHCVRASAAALSLPTIVPARVLGTDEPSKKITVGMIGVGGHGFDYNLAAYLRQPDGRVLMVCDVDRRYLPRAQRPGGSGRHRHLLERGT